MRITFVFAAAAAVAVLLPRIAAADDDSPGLSIYGFARLDVLSNDARMSDAASADFVLPTDTPSSRDGDFAMTPRLSRVGLSIDEWRVARRLTGEGKLEIDFGGGDGTNSLRLRHAYASVAYNRKLQVLAGQTWDLASPLYPSAQNDGQLRFAGNLGDRRPQVRLEALGEHVHVGVGASATGARARMDLDGDGMADGVATEAPMLQWLVEVRQRARGNIARVGLSGHATYENGAGARERRGRSVGLHAFIPVAKKLVALGEGYVGENLADLGGSVGEKVDEMLDPAQMKAIRSVGGWFELAWLPSNKSMLALGTSYDSALDRTVADGHRTRNRTTYGVLRYMPKPALQLGVEYLSWTTEYKNVGSAQANRLDLHATVFF
ncbi:MAG: hypothetical protein KF773_36065 [Deltaproteobacteria bacterium]|nr:hypothetical protein [Deltaproteobacteria bacterium]